MSRLVSGKSPRSKSFLRDGHDINQPDAFGATPLMIAVVSGKIEIVKFLLDRTDPSIPAKDGYTLMHAAAFSGDKEMVKLVLSLGLAINPIDMVRTALHL